MEQKRKYNFIYFLLLVLIFSCSKENKKSISSMNTIKTESIHTDERIGYINLSDSLLIKYKHGFIGNIKDLSSVLDINHKDSTNQILCGFSLEDDSVANMNYYNSNEVEVNSKSYAIRKLIITDEFRITYKNNVFTNKSSEVDFLKKFKPISYDKDYHIKGSNKKYSEIVMPVCIGCDGEYIRFYFLDGNFYMIEYFIPC